MKPTHFSVPSPHLLQLTGCLILILLLETMAFAQVDRAVLEGTDNRSNRRHDRWRNREDCSHGHRALRTADHQSERLLPISRSRGGPLLGDRFRYRL